MKGNFESRGGVYAPNSKARFGGGWEKSVIVGNRGAH